MKLKVILLEPAYQVNLGYMARTAMNFGVEKLHIVKPRAKINGRQAIMYAKHAAGLLAGAKIYGSLAKAIEDCDIVVGTTGIWKKARSNFGNVGMAEDIAERLARTAKKGTTVGLLIGRDDTGLTSEELGMCDMVAYIGTNDAYPVMNISHALAVMLYLFTRKGFSEAYRPMLKKSPKAKELEELYFLFGSSLKGKRIRDKKAVERIFRRMVRAAQPSEQEVHALITALK